MHENRIAFKLVFFSIYSKRSWAKLLILLPLFEEWYGKRVLKVIRSLSGNMSPLAACLTFCTIDVEWALIYVHFYYALWSCSREGKTWNPLLWDFSAKLRPFPLCSASRVFIIYLKRKKWLEFKRKISTNDCCKESIWTHFSKRIFYCYKVNWSASICRNPASGAIFVVLIWIAKWRINSFSIECSFISFMDCTFNLVCLAVCRQVSK